ncbi:MAG: archaeosortase/exosortase family protein [Gemmatimonadetes bacterium]|mgnify:CR=1 FL=1|nr:archaeosortase/exosortase family protein [Gemmatimonadota bacterium]MBT6148332.1 archaeosortase/exosortase family protein [Gemmatimonadota bacterium]MBT7858782.1 archaeosortase/exosortase family protein [Gemmatimonadota bacterium]
MSIDLGLDERGKALRFCARFCAWLGGMALLFPWVDVVMARLHLLPVAAVAGILMGLAGVGVDLDTSTVASGHATLEIGRVTYLVTHACTGIYALVLLIAAVMAYPCSGADRLRGFALGIPALCAFGALRLFVLGIIAQLQPAWIDLFHEYIMEVVSVAFVLYVWIHWIDRIVAPPSHN